MTYQEIVALALAAYETIARSLPTSKNLSLIHKVLKALVFVSSFLNIEKKPAVRTGKIAPLVFVALMLSFASCKSIETVTCRSKKYVEITVLRSGSYYTAVVPVCDTVEIIDKPKTKAINE